MAFSFSRIFVFVFKESKYVIYFSDKRQKIISKKCIGVILYESIFYDYFNLVVEKLHDNHISKFFEIYVFHCFFMQIIIYYT